MHTSACCGCFGSGKPPYFVLVPPQHIYSAKTKYTCMSLDYHAKPSESCHDRTGNVLVIGLFLHSKRTKNRVGFSWRSVL